MNLGPGRETYSSRRTPLEAVFFVEHGFIYVVRATCFNAWS